MNWYRCTFPNRLESLLGSEIASPSIVILLLALINEKESNKSCWIRICWIRQRCLRSSMRFFWPETRCNWGRHCSLIARVPRFVTETMWPTRQFQDHEKSIIIALLHPDHYTDFHRRIYYIWVLSLSQPVLTQSFRVCAAHFTSLAYNTNKRLDNTGALDKLILT